MSAKRRAKRRAGRGAPAGSAPHGDRDHGALIAIGLVIAIAAGFVWHAKHWEFTQDDAYISLRYAKNLVDGHGLVFNEGERVEGYSNFTWTLLLALLLKLGAPAVEASRWLGIGFGTLTVLMTARLAKSLEGKWGGAAVGAAAIVAGNPAFALWSTGGLETALYAFLVTAGLERALAPDVGRRGRRLAPILLSLAALTRPDGPLVFALWFGLRLVDRPTTRLRPLALDAALFVAPLLPYAAWKLWYYGDLLPNTYYAKAGLSTIYFSRGVTYAWEWFRAYGAWGAAPLLAVLSLGSGRWRGVEARLLFIWLGVAAYIVIIGGDVLLLHRFWLPILPIGAVLIVRGTQWVADLLPASRPLARPGATLTLVGVLVAIGIQTNAAITVERRNTESNFILKMSLSGDWMKNKFPPDATLAITTIGAISYHSGLRVIDMLGLTDYEVARNPRLFDGLTDTWREMKYNAESVLRREPDGIIFSTEIRPSSAAERALYLYEWFHEAYYAYYYRSKPWHRAVQTVFVKKPDAPPFHADLVDVDGYDFLDNYIEAHVARGRTNDYDAALDYMDRVLETAPAVFSAPREWRAVLLDDLQRPDASDALIQAVAEDSYATAAIGRLANRYLIAGDLETAENLAQRLMSIDPDDSSAWAAMAEIRRQQGRVDEAFDYARKAATLWSTNPAQLLLLGNLATRTGRFTLAHRCFRGISELNPSPDLINAGQRGLQILDALDRGEITLEQLEQAERSPN